MGDPACDRRFCPSCDAPATRVDEECPECGVALEDVVDALHDEDELDFDRDDIDE